MAQLQLLRLAYLHVITSRVDKWTEVDSVKPLDFVFESWRKSVPVIVTGVFDKQSAEKAIGVDFKNFKVAIGFGQAFASTPDLVACLKQGIKSNLFNGDLAYTPGTPRGYIDYIFLART